MRATGLNPAGNLGLKRNFHFPSPIHAQLNCKARQGFFAQGTAVLKSGCFGRTVTFFPAPVTRVGPESSSLVEFVLKDMPAAVPWAAGRAWMGFCVMPAVPGCDSGLNAQPGTFSFEKCAFFPAAVATGHCPLCSISQDLAESIWRIRSLRPESRTDFPFASLSLGLTP